MAIGDRRRGPFVVETRRRGHVCETVMALWTVHALFAAYCCCLMAALLLPQPAAGMAVVAGGGSRVTAAGLAVPPPPPPPSSAARNKRWSTTFGANSSNKNVTVNNAVQDCTTDSDCLDTPFTSCALDSSDKKRKCLCADGKLPSNGDCLKKPRALKTSCETDVECLPNAICKNNATLTNPRLKICACKDGFTEEKESCNYADLLNFNYTILLIAVFTSWIWNDRRS